MKVGKQVTSPLAPAEGENNHPVVSEPAENGPLECDGTMKYDVVLGDRALPRA